MPRHFDVRSGNCELALRKGDGLGYETCRKLGRMERISRLLSKLTKCSRGGGAIEDMQLRNGKEVVANEVNRRKVQTGPAEIAAAVHLLDLPNELLEAIVIGSHILDVKDLCSVAQVCPRLKSISVSCLADRMIWRCRFLKKCGYNGVNSVQETDSRWKSLFEEKWGAGSVTRVTEDAVKELATWKKLYEEKSVTDREAAPWSKSAPSEVNAFTKQFSALPDQKTAALSELALVFLVDGSGSVSAGNLLA